MTNESNQSQAKDDASASSNEPTGTHPAEASSTRESEKQKPNQPTLPVFEVDAEYIDPAKVSQSTPHQLPELEFEGTLPVEISLSRKQLDKQPEKTAEKAQENPARNPAGSPQESPQESPEGSPAEPPARHSAGQPVEKSETVSKNQSVRASTAEPEKETASEAITDPKAHEPAQTSQSVKSSQSSELPQPVPFEQPPPEISAPISELSGKLMIQRPPIQQNFQIRAANKQDESSIRTLLVTETVDSGNVLDLDGKDSDLRNIERFYFGNDGAFFVAEHDRKIIGCLGVAKASDDVLGVKRLVIAKDWRRQGIGKRLMDLALVFAGRLDYAVVELNAPGPDSLSAFALSCGFTVCAGNENGSGNGNEKGSNTRFEYRLKPLS